MLALESRLRRNVEVLAGEIGERHVGRPAALHSAESYIAGALSELDFEVSRQTYIAEGVASVRVSTGHFAARRVCDELRLVVPKISLNEAGIGENGEVASLASY
jgi:hypothetical protein